MTAHASSGLPPCPASPNCVSTQEQSPARRLEPLRYQGSRQAAQERLKAVALAMGGRLAQEEDGLLRLEFSSTLFGFVDDVVFLLPEEPLVHMRSASRTGWWDLGANRRRLEEVRQRFEANG